MKVLFITAACLEDKAKGYVTHIIELVNNLRSLDVGVTLVSRLNRDEKYSSYQDNPEDMQVTTNSPFVFMLKVFIIVFQKARKYDLIYVRDPHSGFAALVGKYLFRKKIVYEVNGIHADELKLYGRSFIKRVYHILVTLFENISIKNADFLITVTDQLKYYLMEKKRISSQKIAAIQNGVNTGLFQPMKHEELTSLRNRFNISEKNVLIGFIGALSPWYDFDCMIEASKFISDKDTSPKIIIIGAGSEEDRIRKKITEIGVGGKFILSGPVDYREAPQMINLFDICLIPLKHERNAEIGVSPLKLYEYLACGKPVVASHVPGLEIIESNNLGLLYEPDNPIDFADKINELINKLGSINAISKNARKYALDHSWEKTAQKVRDTLQESLDGRK